MRRRSPKSPRSPRSPRSSSKAFAGPAARALHLEAGAIAEQLSCDHLRGRGLVCLASNFRCRVGEIDLVMRDRHCVVMVEVRYRADLGRGSPAESITRDKQRRLARAATCWLAANPDYANWPLRFDVVSVSGQLNAAEISWDRAAIEFDEEDW